MLGVEKIIERKTALIKGQLTASEVLELSVALRDTRNYLWNKFGSNHGIALSLDNALNMLSAIDELLSCGAINPEARIADLINIAGAFHEYVEREKQLAAMPLDGNGCIKE
ncbi:hypothetical protein [Desulfurispira natronophila]|uniref:Uncharacterized protein n=1 Tax=Desulfurispira natronophila TaxID=682562 RepID=A0A7W7Y3Y1_9BACT|nr:hypothetical protein [Desulfurispira natronophila]MBB5021578.1 hypothetical protein [Desulfurispira natronophila]